MLLPRMDNESRETGSRFRIVILTVFKCVFICMSTPEKKSVGYKWAVCMGSRNGRNAPVIVPCTTDPFFNSIVTVSLFNFIKNLKNGGGCQPSVVDSNMRRQEGHAAVFWGLAMWYIH